MRTVLAFALLLAAPPVHADAALRLAQVNLSGGGTGSTEAQACLRARREAERACIRIGRDAVFDVPCTCRPGGQGVVCTATTECIPKY
jgi:hypothetical protein